MKKILTIPVFVLLPATGSARVLVDLGDSGRYQVAKSLHRRCLSLVVCTIKTVTRPTGKPS